jgi:hypothetical protein
MTTRDDSPAVLVRETKPDSPGLLGRWAADCDPCAVAGEPRPRVDEADQVAGAHDDLQHGGEPTAVTRAVPLDRGRQPARAVLLTTRVPGYRPARIPALITGTPGLFLVRRRTACAEPALSGPWRWGVIAACGVYVVKPVEHAGLPRYAASVLAAALGGTGVRWTDREVLYLLAELTDDRLVEVTTALRSFGVWTPSDPVAAVARARDRYLSALLEGSA